MAGQERGRAVGDRYRSEAIAFWIAGGVGAAAVARRLLDSVLPPRMRCDGDVRLVLTELVNNGVVHGGADEATGLELTIVLSERIVRIEVTDPGSGGAAAAVTVAAKPPDTQPSGRGLLILERLSSNWGIETGERTRAWAEIYLRASARAR